jgi:hypothetical protein
MLAIRDRLIGIKIAHAEANCNNKKVFNSMKYNLLNTLTEGGLRHPLLHLRKSGRKPGKCEAGIRRPPVYRFTSTTELNAPKPSLTFLGFAGSAIHFSPSMRNLYS